MQKKKKIKTNHRNFTSRRNFAGRYLGPQTSWHSSKSLPCGDYSIYVAFPWEIISCFSALLALNETPSLWAFRLLEYILHVLRLIDKKVQHCLYCLYLVPSMDFFSITKTVCSRQRWVEADFFPFTGAKSASCPNFCSATSRWCLDTGHRENIYIVEQGRH